MYERAAEATGEEEHFGLLRLPPDWKAKADAHIASLLSIAAMEKRKRARPRKEHDLVAYPLLLAFYRAVYGRAPGSSPGPAHRFLREWFRQTRDYLNRATAPRERGLTAPKWDVPGDELLAKLIPRYRRRVSEAVRSEVEDLIRACEAAVAGAAGG